MPITLKRSSAGKAEEETDDRAERMKLCAEQLVAHQDAAAELLNRFARGWLMRQEKGWTWEEPDYEADPETWPPLAKVLWLLDRGYSEMSGAQFMVHFRQSPEFCPNCHPDEPMPKGYHQAMCSAHNNRTVIGVLARGMGFTE